MAISDIYTHQHHHHCGSLFSQWVLIGPINQPFLSIVRCSIPPHPAWTYPIPSIHLFIFITIIALIIWYQWQVTLISVSWDCADRYVLYEQLDRRVQIVSSTVISQQHKCPNYTVDHSHACTNHSVTNQIIRQCNSLDLCCLLYILSKCYCLYQMIQCALSLCFQVGNVYVHQGQH